MRLAHYQLHGAAADQFWDGRIARSLSTELLEIEDADHGLFVPGPLAASAVIPGQVITAVEDSIDRLAR